MPDECDELRKILALIGENKTEMLQAKDQFVRSNLRLVLSIAKKYSHPGLICWICAGRNSAYESGGQIQLPPGLQVSTYATWWVRRALRVQLLTREGLSGFPSHDRSHEPGMKPRMSLPSVWATAFSAELAKELKTSVLKVRDILKVAQEPVSLETTLGITRMTAEQVY